ncbi:MAG: PilN domain-containing protein [bacterium]|nr:PilN domain-containing protein [bacterium]
MINLLPKEEKELLVKDFYMRFAVIFFGFLSLAILIASVLLFPSYLFSQTNKDAVLQKLETQKNSPVPESEEGNSLIIQELNKKISTIETINKDKFVVSENIVKKIILDKMSDIKIISMVYSKDSLGKKVTINGIASSRERLLLFRRKLEGDIFFKQVDLPISNFIKGSNIQFSLNLIPA